LSTDDQDRVPKHIKVEAQETLRTDDSLSTQVARATEQVQQAIKGLSPDQVETVARAAGVIPDQPTTNLLWLWIVRTFCIVAVAAVLGILLVAVGFKLGGGSPNAQILLTVFTTTVGFLGGLFAPSPARDQAG
jgi:hypothetical protein